MTPRGASIENLIAGRSAALAPLGLQYADFAHWQNRQDYSAQIEYWERQLRGLPQLDLPTDRPHPAAQSFDGAWQAIAVSAELTGQLRQIGRQEGATLFMTLLAAFQTLLHRHSGQQDFAVGVFAAAEARA